MQVAAVILAAGASTRFGSPKQLARIGELTMLETVIGLAGRAGLVPIVVVVPPGLPVPPGAIPAVNDRPMEGISRSIRMGLAAVPPQIEAAVILLGDEPALSPDAIAAVLAAARPGLAVVAARAGDRVGPPVLLRRGRFDLAGLAHGDEGLASVLRGLPDLVTVPLADVPVDIDTPEDLARLTAG